MPAAHAALTRLALAFSAGFLLLSSADRRPPAQASPRARLESAQRLGDVLRQPGRITAADVESARKAWGVDAAQGLETLRRSER